MAVFYKHPRTTRAGLTSLATTNGLKIGQIYLLTDEQRLAVATQTNAFTTFATESEIASLRGITTVSRNLGVIQRIGSYWKNPSTASAQVNPTNPTAQPIMVHGREITSVDFHVQGSITAGAKLHVALYDSDAVTRLPTTRLWTSGEIDMTTQGSGSKSLVVSPGITDKEEVWVAYYLSASAQFATGAMSGIAAAEIGLTTSGGTNVPVVGLAAPSAFSSEMPNPFGSSPTPLTSGSTPQFFIRCSP